MADYMQRLINSTNQAVTGALVRAVGDLHEQFIVPTKYARKRTMYGERIVVYYNNEWLWTTGLVEVA